MHNLKKLLQSRNMTQVELAHRLGTGPVTVNRWIKGKRHPDKATLQRIADMLQCEIEEVTGEINIMTVEERRLLLAFRDIPADKRAAIWSIVEALRIREPATEPPQSGDHALTKPDKKTS